MEEKLNIVLTKIKNRKATGLKIPQALWKTGNLMTYFFDYVTLSINKIQ